ncbi:MAG: tRNA pseudouridine(55) synthase TruB [Tenericutes bacterium]|nr:tRNA pseudouridine(55) synthase TruB [Mycoplasmatota bacterium]
MDEKIIEEKVVDGIIIVDKPKEYTSHDVVNIARKAMGTKRVGHIGTLDPNATGVLVLCVGRATKLAKYFENHSKKYIAEIKLGVQTDTDDLTGKVIESSDVSDITEAMILEALEKFKGKIEQTPPNYSAVKINGKKLYELARRDIRIPSIEPRNVEIFDMSDFKMLENGDTKLFQIKLSVSKGTYIRSIARDLGLELGCFGSLKELRRTEVENFHIEDAISIDQLKAGEVELFDPFDYLNMQKIVIDDAYKSYINNGRFLNIALFPGKKDTIIYSKQNEVLAIYHYDEAKDSMRMSVKWW